MGGVAISIPVQTETALLESQARLQLALEAANLGTFVYHVREEQLEPDGRMLTLFGHTGEQNLNLSEALTQRIHPEDRAPYMAAMAHSTDPAGEGKLRQDIRVLQEDGSVRWVAITAQTVFEGQPLQAVRMYGSGADITERKCREENLAFLAQIGQDFAPRLSPQEIMEQLGEKLAHHLGLSRCNFSLVEEEANRITVLYDWRRDNDAPSLMGQHQISNFVSEVGRQHYRLGKLVVVGDALTDPRINATAELLQALRIGSVVDAPYMENGCWKFLLGACRSEASVWHEHEVELIRELAGRIYVRLERARAEAQLSRNAQTFYNLIQNTPFGVYVVDSQFRLSQVSAGSQRVFSNVSPLLGRDFAEVLRIVWPEPFASEAIGHFRHTLETGEPYRSPSTTEQRGDIAEVESYDWKIERIELPDGQYGVVCYFYDLTEIKRVEAALRESEERFRHMADHAPVMVWVTEADAECTYLSKSWYDFTGQTPETGLGMGWLNAVHPEDRQNAEDVFVKATQERQGFKLEYRLRRFDGEYCWAIDSARPRFAEDSRFMGYIGSVVEIHEQKRTQLRLERLQYLTSQLAQALEPSAVMDVILRETTQVLGAEAGVLRLLRGKRLETVRVVSPNQAIASAYRDIDLETNIPSAEAARSQRPLFFPSKASLVERYPHLAATVEQFATHSSAYLPLLSSQNQVLGVLTLDFPQERIFDPEALAFLKSIAHQAAQALERSRLLDTLKHSNERFELAQKIARGYVFEWDLKSDAIERSQGFGGLLGYTSEQIAIPEFFKQLIHPDDRETCWTTVEQTLQSGETFKLSYRLRHQEGHYLDMEENAQVMRDAQGQAVRVVGSVQDVSERNRLEEGLRTSEERFRLAADSANALIYEVDLVAKRTVAIYGLERMVGAVEQPSLDSDWWHSRIHPEDLPGHLEELEKHLVEGGSFVAEYRVWHQEGRWIDVQDTRLALLREGRPVRLVGAIRDISEHKQAEAERTGLLEQALQSEKEAMALARIANALSLADPLSTNLSKLAENVTDLSGAIACSIKLYSDDLSRVIAIGSHNQPRELEEGLAVLRQAGVHSPSYWALTRREMKVVNNFRDMALADPRYKLLRPQLRKARWNTVVALPLLHGSGVLGVVLVYYAHGDDPSVSELLHLSTLSSQVALVVQNARLFEQSKQKTALEERQKLARELHDSVSQALYGIALGIKGSLGFLNNPERARESLLYASRMTETAMAEMKNLIFELRPESLEQEGLVVALEKHLAALKMRHLLKFNIELGAEPAIPLHLKEMLLRIAQEALTNALKHAQAQTIALSLTAPVKRVCLEIRDDGIGFDPSQNFPGHLGLKSMKERAEAVGARFKVKSQSAKGTVVRVEV